MIGKPTRTMRATSMAFALAVMAACSTQRVVLQATPAADMNPSRAGGSGTLKVHVYFLKKEDTFLSAGKALSEYTEARKKDGKAPAFCAADVLDVQEIVVAPPASADAAPVTKAFEVSSEAVGVGLVADFQQHAENDEQEVWRIYVPIEGGVCAFRITGRKLEQAKPKKREKQQHVNTDG